MGEKLAGSNIAIALLANTLATGATLTTLIFTFGPISGGHFNPAVTLADASQGGITWSDAPAYLAAQVLGAFIGVAAAHLMFGEALLQFSHHARAGDSAGRCAGLCSSAAPRRFRRDCSFPLACAIAAYRSERRCVSTCRYWPSIMTNVC